MPAAHKGLAHVAKVMAATAVDVLTDKVLLAQVKKRISSRSVKNRTTARSPAEVKPPIQPRPDSV